MCKGNGLKALVPACYLSVLLNDSKTNRLVLLFLDEGDFKSRKGG